MHAFPLFLLIHHGQLYPPSQPRLCRQPRSSLHKNCQRPAVLTLLGFVPCFIAASLRTRVGEVAIQVFLSLFSYHLVFSLSLISSSAHTYCISLSLVCFDSVIQEHSNCEMEKILCISADYTA
ncbi:hypothetical protein BDV36DRAFT_13585 [Aspergillus pseudocaelatus]|uniref:Uncharacterized protein n=1 Tax=Aspergillus pseudocaelatus TaxID=1825620 RepID=A0ABQ6WAK2_9EURO|nr:hypothetical protein BDV36DRAFT_13585 [Aspergillus pseudocaelatus]